jgi:hypothetical protein
MSGKSAGFHDVIGTLDTAAQSSVRTGLAMLDGTSGAARLVFSSSGKRHRTAVLRRCASPDGGCASRSGSGWLSIRGCGDCPPARRRATGSMPLLSPRLAITASGGLRPLDFAALRRWL